MREIAVDLNRALGPLNRSFSHCVSASRAYTLMLRRHREHLKMAAQECGFRYVRFHGLLQDDMGVYREDAFGNPIWGWQYVDEVYDFLMEIGLRPFVVLDFMPEALKSGEATVYWEKANVTPPRDLRKWALVVEAVARHFLERYGEDEVAEWFFEVWNEPDLDFFFKGALEDYLKLYEASARAVKAVSKRFKVGGPAVSGNVEYITRLAAHCRENSVPIDFFSGHHYCARPFDEGKTVHPEAGYPAWSPGPSWALGNYRYNERGGETLDRYNEAIRQSAIPALPLYVTEWGLSFDYWDPLRDSYEAASFTLSRLRANMDKAQCLSLCEVSDIFEEDGPPTQGAFHGGFGLVTLQGIRKPAYFAYWFLNQLCGERAACGDPCAIACGYPEHGAELLFWDETVRQDRDNKHYYNAPHPPRPLGDARVSFTGIAPGAYRLEIRVAGFGRNDAYTQFLGLPDRGSLSRTQAEALRAAASGMPEHVEEVEVDEVGAFECLVSLRENDACLIKLIRV